MIHCTKLTARQPTPNLIGIHGALTLAIFSQEPILRIASFLLTTLREVGPQIRCRHTIQSTNTALRITDDHNAFAVAASYLEHATSNGLFGKTILGPTMLAAEFHCAPLAPGDWGLT